MVSFLYPCLFFFSFFFFNATATTEIYTLSLHDALPIYFDLVFEVESHFVVAIVTSEAGRAQRSIDSRVVGDRKSTRLNSSHQIISYAVFCLKKKKNNTKDKRKTHIQ